MALVEGGYCPRPFHRCQRWTDPEGSALHGVRCAQYEEPARCLSPQRKHVRYCIDRDEFLAPGEELPQSLRTAAEARAACTQANKRLCTESEWTFACEGEAIRPYPYGFRRDSAACNADLGNLVTSAGELSDLRAKPGSFPRCVSPAGVRDLSGNLEEYVSSDGSPEVFVRKGAYWQPGANHCRASQPHPDRAYRGVEVGFRCCSDVAVAR
jgi:formylglycine-generating enzyme required for sulfatase activity